MIAAPRLVVRGRAVDLATPALMGIVNATPDSFSDGGELASTGDQVARAIALADEGAAMVDVGGQSGITGVPEVEVAEEADRVVALVASLAAAAPHLLVSVDTYRPGVVGPVLAAGAAVVNDVSGLRYPDIAGLVAGAGAGLVIMHTRARPKVKVLDDHLYDEAGGVTADVVAFLEDKMAVATAAGVPEEAIVLDPGPDFAKTPAQTVTVLRQLDRVRALGRPLLLAVSRKDFVGAVTRRSPRERLAGTLAAVGHLAGQPGTILRVHDVAAAADFLAVADVLAGRVELAPETRLPVELRRQVSPPPAR